MLGYLCQCKIKLNWGEMKEYKYITEKKYEHCFEMGMDSEDLFLEMKSFFQCPSCGKLYFFKNRVGNAVQEYDLVEE